jgi:hypothetical protein
MDEGSFYRLWKKANTRQLNDRALVEHERHRHERPLCHTSRADISSCRCTCAGVYHGGRLPVFSDQVDDNGL